jgi:hypothetical protein
MKWIGRAFFALTASFGAANMCVWLSSDGDSASLIVAIVCAFSCVDWLLQEPVE